MPANPRLYQARAVLLCAGAVVCDRPGTGAAARRGADLAPQSTLHSTCRSGAHQAGRAGRREAAARSECARAVARRRPAAAGARALAQALRCRTAGGAARHGGTDPPDLLTAHIHIHYKESPRSHHCTPCRHRPPPPAGLCGSAGGGRDGGLPGAAGSRPARALRGPGWRPAAAGVCTLMTALCASVAPPCLRALLAAGAETTSSWRRNNYVRELSGGCGYRARAGTLRSSGRRRAALAGCSRHGRLRRRPRAAAARPARGCPGCSWGPAAAAPPQSRPAGSGRPGDAAPRPALQGWTAPVGGLCAEWWSEAVAAFGRGQEARCSSNHSRGAAAAPSRPCARRNGLHADALHRPSRPSPAAGAHLDLGPALHRAPLPPAAAAKPRCQTQWPPQMRARRRPPRSWPSAPPRRTWASAPPPPGARSAGSCGGSGGLMVCGLLKFEVREQACSLPPPAARSAGGCRWVRAGGSASGGRAWAAPRCGRGRARARRPRRPAPAHPSVTSRRCCAPSGRYMMMPTQEKRAPGGPPAGLMAAEEAAVQRCSMGAGAGTPRWRTRRSRSSM